MKKVLMLALVAVMSLGLLSACGGGGGAVHKLEVTAGDNGQMSYNPATLTVKKGEKVEVTLINKDAGQNHTFVVTDLSVKSAQVVPGKTGTVNFTPNKTGTFEFFCDIPGHKDGGMVGKLTVTD
jgi:uncharacterized cupredoxin-like copper-binding protein